MFRSAELIQRMNVAEKILRKYCSRFGKDELNILEFLRFASNLLELRERLGMLDPPQVRSSLKLLEEEAEIEIDIYINQN